MLRAARPEWRVSFIMAQHLKANGIISDFLFFRHGISFKSHGLNTSNKLSIFYNGCQRYENDLSIRFGLVMKRFCPPRRELPKHQIKFFVGPCLFMMWADIRTDVFRFSVQNPSRFLIVIEEGSFRVDNWYSHSHAIHCKTDEFTQLAFSFLFFQLNMSLMKKTGGRSENMNFSFDSDKKASGQFLLVMPDLINLLRQSVSREGDNKSVTPTLFLPHQGGGRGSAVLRDAPLRREGRYYPSSMSYGKKSCRDLFTFILCLLIKTLLHKGEFAILPCSA